MLALHFEPVRSDAAAPETMNTLFLVARDLADRERDAGVRHVDDHVDLVDVDTTGWRCCEPTSGLFWWSPRDQLDLDVRIGLGEVGDRELGGGDRARAADVGIEARHVAEHADLDVDLLRLRRAAEQRGGQCRKSPEFFSIDAFLLLLC